MAIRKLGPDERDLGYVRLWRDNLAEIVKLIQDCLIPKLKDVCLRPPVVVD